MNLVCLDTNALIWFARGSLRLGNEARTIAEYAAMEGRLYVSAMSFWEIGMLVAKGRIKLDRPASLWRRASLDLGIEEVPLAGGVGILSTELEGLPNDPADRIIVATAVTLEATLITADGSLLRWEGALERHNARL